MAKRADPASGKATAAPDASLLDKFEIKKNEFKEYYANQVQLFASAEKAFRNLLQQLCESNEIDIPKITSRVKRRDECIKKFSLKYQNEAEKKDDYHIKEYISDIIGVRITCLYETDIEIISLVIRENFDVIGITDKTQLLLSDIRSFGYKGMHFDLKLNEGRHALPEYSRYKNVQFELQLRSIVQDAWSEVEHRLRYKKQSPPTIQRRIIRIAALFELADQEFSALNVATKELESQAITTDNSQATSGESGVLDAFSFLSIASKLHPSYKFEAQAVDGFVDEIKKMNPSLTVLEVKDAVTRLRPTVWKYKQAQRAKEININPFTEMRLVLYFLDRVKFEEILYPNQRKQFDDWLATEGADQNG